MPIELPDGVTLKTVRDAIKHLAATVPAKERDMPQIKSKRSAEALQIVCAESGEHRKKSHLQQGCSQWTTIRTT
jgi:hypothetical protein